MKTPILVLLLALAFGINKNNETKTDYPKALVNYSSFNELIKRVETHRQERLVSLDEFNAKAKEPNTVILDARSKAMYDLKHIKGAIHLNFSDFTQYSLDSLLFDVHNGNRNTQILIYCNNNFLALGNQFKLNNQLFANMDRAFISKVALPKFEILQAPVSNLTLALNIPTYINLYGYGYTNVYELNELVDISDPRIEFEGTFKNN